MRSGVKRIDSWVDTKFGNSSGIQVSEGGGGGRIGKIISRHIDGRLRRCNGSLSGVEVIHS
jgi:hypothetical protein